MDKALKAAKNKEYQARWREKNREKQAAYARAYRAAHPEEMKAKYAANYQATKEQRKAKLKQKEAEGYDRYAKHGGKAAYMKKYYEDNKERLREYGKVYSRKSNDKFLAELAGRPRAEACEICSRSKVNKTTPHKTVFDHNHKTGEFRGWICQPCNDILGKCEDNPEILLKIVEYLRTDGLGKGPLLESVNSALSEIEASSKDR
jgi:hypothetical protein